MSANPYKREWGEFTRSDGTRIRISTSLQAGSTRELWNTFEEDAEEQDDPGRAALRIRWAARVACARLRWEIADLRLGRTPNWSDLREKAEAELDRARRVLAKMEKSDG